MELLLVISTGILLVIVVAKNKKHNLEKALKQEGIDAVSHIKSLISLIQAHRGLTGALLSGDTSVANKILALRPQIENESLCIGNTLVADLERWKAFDDHWQRLIHSYKNLAIGNNFDQHTSMVKNLAYLLEDTAESAHLTSDFLHGFDHVGLIWRELVETTESIGQCRAIGTGVAVQRKCSSVDKIRLSYLIKKMTDISENTLQRISCLPEEKSRHDLLVREAAGGLKALISVVSDDIINQQKVNVDSRHYFQLATDTMTRINLIFEHQIKQLDGAI